MNVKRVYRLYREQGLQLRSKVPKRRVKARLWEGRTVAIRVNQVWSMDFVHDQLATGRKIRVLTIVDTFSRYSPAVDPPCSYRGEDVVQTLEKVCQKIGYPRAIWVDQGSEFVSRDLDLWARLAQGSVRRSRMEWQDEVYQKGVILDFSRPGKPTDNAFIESFNAKFSQECLNAH